jgi:hypothetical protein
MGVVAALAWGCAALPEAVVACAFIERGSMAAALAARPSCKKFLRFIPSSMVSSSSGFD